ncbi:MAG: HlyD family efflux transporter periplasmic adaptor subunit [Verrucomicrobia bacterium]|jgi:membrane fusion protein, macrolide-specific efflux system|nr:HlyD family efflux transporter periplasmic adaptor subunit [Verrucomicrobiota bacterium]MBT7702098.1 HlyD family efflux transporter periplasmic adaptor subunit [Verrucomicrobiota bacterium]
MKRKWFTVITATAMLATAGATWRWSRNSAENDIAYEKVSFIRQRMETTMDATAVVEPRNRLEIKPPIGGRIDEVLVSEGQDVTKGDIVARMSSTERATLLDAARARGAEALAKWQDAYKSTPLIAPLAGTIIARDKEPGQTVTASDTILVLSDRLIVSAHVDETDIGKVRVGQRAWITLDAYQDVEVEGTVSRIAFEATTVNNVTIYEVEVEPDTIPTCMKSGMTATVAFIIAEADDALTLPAGAVGAEAGVPFVLVRNPESDTPPQRWNVQTGLSSGGRVEILDGLEGDELVVKKAFAIKRGESGASSPFVPQEPRRRP